MRTPQKLIFILILLSGCIRELQYEVASVPKQLVVNSIIQANRYIEVNVSTLQSIVDTTYQFINDATISITTANEVDTLTSQGNGNYLSHNMAKEGGIYSLSVSKSGYPTVFATDTVPFLCKIIKATKEETLEIDEDGWPYILYSVTFDCDTANPQLYELMFIEQSRSWDEDIYSLGFNSEDIEVDPIIQQAGVNSLTYFFSSAGISANSYTLKMKMYRGWSGGGNFEKPLILTGETNFEAVVLRMVSQLYVDYRISWEKHQMLRNDSSKIEYLIELPLAGQQPEMYSNIENGHGVFISYCQSYFILD